MRAVNAQTAEPARMRSKGTSVIAKIKHESRLRLRTNFRSTASFKNCIQKLYGVYAGDVTNAQLITDPTPILKSLSYVSHNIQGIQNMKFKFVQIAQVSYF